MYTIVEDDSNGIVSEIRHIKYDKPQIACKWHFAVPDEGKRYVILKYQAILWVAIKLHVPYKGSIE